MAKAGTFAAYKQLQPNQKDLSQDLMRWNDIDARKRQQDFQEEQAEQARQERQNLRKDKLRETYGKYIDFDRTGSRSLDNNLAKFVGVHVMEKQYGLLDKLMTVDPNSREGVELQMKLQSLQATPAKLKQVNDILTTKFSDYKEGVDGNKYWRDPEFEKMFQNNFEDAVLMLDDNMNIVVGFADTNKDGVIDIRDEFYSYDEITKQMPERQFIERYNPDELIAGRFKNKEIPIRLDVIKTGFGETLEIEALDEPKMNRLSEHEFYQNINRDEEGVIVDAEPSKFAISEMIRLGLDLDSPESVEKARENYVEMVRNRISETNKQKQDLSGIAAVTRANKAKDNREDKSTSGTPVPSTETNWGDKFNVLDTDNYLTVPIQNPRTVGTLKSGDETLTDAKVTGYTVDKNDHIVVTAEVPRTKQKTESDNQMLQEMYDAETNTRLKDRILEQMGKSNGTRITIPGQTERVSVILPNEDVERATGLTKEQAKTNAKKAEGATSIDDPLGIM